MELKTNNFKRQMETTDFQEAQNKELVFSVADEIPYLRHDQNFGDYYEVLEISDDAIVTERLVKNMPFLKDHDHSVQLGAVKKFWIDYNNKKLYVSVKFSRSKFAQSIKEDIMDLIRQNTSIGYYVDQFKLDGQIDGIKVLRAVKWTPYQCSSVSVPASVFVGYNRSIEIQQKGQDMNAQNNKNASVGLAEQTKLETKEANIDLENKDLDGENLERKSEETPKTEEETKKEKQLELKAEVCPECGKDPCECEKEEKSCGGEQKPEEKSLDMKLSEAVAEPQLAQKHVETTPVQQISYEDIAKEIRSLGQLSDDIEVAKQFIAQKKSLEDFKNYLKNKNSNKSSNSIQDENKMEKKYFSISKLITAINEGKVDTESYEYQTNAQNKRSFNIENNRAVILTKEDLDFNAKSRAFSGTVAGVGYPNGGDTLVQTLYRPDLYAGNLRPQLTLDKTGYFDISSPDGRPVEWPVCTGGIQAGIVDLDGKLPSADMQWKTVKLQGKKIGAITQIPYSLLSQSAPKADAKIEEDLIKALYQVRDTVAFTGRGYNADPTSGYYEPVGILNTTGVNTVTVTGSYTWKDMLEAENKIREANVMSDNLAFVMNGETYVELCSTAKNPSGGFVYGFICEDDKIKNFPVYVNNAIPSGTIILGDFNELVVCDFDGLQIIPDPYTGLDSQMIRIAGWMQMDSVVQRPEAFTIITKA